MKRRCIIHANCQGEPLQELLALSPSFSKYWTVRFVTNYTKEPLTAEDMGSCDLFLYQHLGSQWGELASERLLSLLSPQAMALRVPNMYFNGYWPLLDTKSAMDFGDFLLDRLVAEGTAKPVVLKLYFEKPITTVVDVVANAQESLAREKIKEAGVTITTWPVLEALWRHEKLYYTWNHPGERLLTHVAEGVLSALGLPPLHRAAQGYKAPYANFEQPLHPQLEPLLHLPFCREDTQYAVFGKTLTCRQYVSRYIDCLAGGYADSFLGYLQLV